MFVDADWTSEQRSRLGQLCEFAGKVCLSVERFVVEQPRQKDSSRVAWKKTKKLRIGPGSDPRPTLAH